MDGYAIRLKQKTKKVNTYLSYFCEVLLKKALIDGRERFCTRCSMTIHILLLLSRRPRESAAGQDVKMQVKYRLSGTPTIINHYTVSALYETFLFCNFICYKEKMTYEFTIAFLYTVYVLDMTCRDNERVNRCLRIYVFKCNSPIIFINNSGRNFSFNDFAEYAIWIETHRRTPLCDNNLKTTVKTAAFTCVTCRSCLINHNEERVLIAIVIDILNTLNISGSLALLPELLT